MAAESAELNFSLDLFLAVPTASLIHRKTSISDLFIRLPSNRMIKVAHKGGAIDMERVLRFGEKNVTSLYVLKTEFGEVVSDLVKGAQGLNQLRHVPSDQRVAKFFSIAESVYTELMLLPLSDETFGRAMRLSTEISNTLREKPDFAKLVGTVVSMGDEFARHSIGTVVIASSLAGQLQWTSEKLLGPISMAAFFHDIGLKELPLELQHKNPVEMSRDELALWELHPAIGVKLLSPLPFMTADVLRIVQEHHEIPNGTGFPSRLRLERIFPMARIISFADALTHDLFPVPGTESNGFSPENMIQKIEHVYGTMYGLDLARAARRMFKADPEKD